MCYFNACEYCANNDLINDRKVEQLAMEMFAGKMVICKEGQLKLKVALKSLNFIYFFL